ncbi:hypothetical protein HDV05_004936 [Chytridiales sp. JEL 0842]|nr:hypothetical protein HDV05_004936 [Chytridiales sp. JEL 0842]
MPSHPRVFTRLHDPANSNSNLLKRIHSSIQSAFKSFSRLFGDPSQGAAAAILSRTSLVTFWGLAMHNLPEGISVAFTTASSLRLGVSLCVAIMLHNVLEGMVLALPLLTSTRSPSRVLFLTLINGFMEPLGVLIAYFLGAFSLVGDSSESGHGGGVGGVLCAVAGVMGCIVFMELVPSAIGWVQKGMVGYGGTASSGTGGKWEKPVLGRVVLWTLVGMVGGWCVLAASDAVLEAFTTAKPCVMEECTTAAPEEPLPQSTELDGPTPDNDEHGTTTSTTPTIGTYKAKRTSRPLRKRPTLQPLVIEDIKRFNRENFVSSDGGDSSLPSGHADDDIALVLDGTAAAAEASPNLDPTRKDNKDGDESSSISIAEFPETSTPTSTRTTATQQQLQQDPQQPSPLTTPNTYIDSILYDRQLQLLPKTSSITDPPEVQPITSFKASVSPTSPVRTHWEAHIRLKHALRSQKSIETNMFGCNSQSSNVTLNFGTDDSPTVPCCATIGGSSKSTLLPTSPNTPTSPEPKMRSRTPSVASFLKVPPTKEMQKELVMSAEEHRKVVGAMMRETVYSLPSAPYLYVLSLQQQQEQEQQRQYEQNNIQRNSHDNSHDPFHYGHKISEENSRAPPSPTDPYSFARIGSPTPSKLSTRSHFSLRSLWKSKPPLPPPSSHVREPSQIASMSPNRGHSKRPTSRLSLRSLFSPSSELEEKGDEVPPLPTGNQSVTLREPEGVLHPPSDPIPPLNMKTPLRKSFSLPTLRGTSPNSSRRFKSSFNRRSASNPIAALENLSQEQQLTKVESIESLRHSKGFWQAWNWQKPRDVDVKERDEERVVVLKEQGVN